jgi:hypothetical protein
MPVLQVNIHKDRSRGSAGCARAAIDECSVDGGRQSPGGLAFAIRAYFEARARLCAAGHYPADTSGLLPP